MNRMVNYMKNTHPPPPKKLVSVNVKNEIMWHKRKCLLHLIVYMEKLNHYKLILQNLISFCHCEKKETF